MALNAAERQRKRRMLLKEKGNYEQYKKQHCVISKKSYYKKKERERQLSESKQKLIAKKRKESIRKKVAKCRAMKKERGVCVTASDGRRSPFRSVQAFGKALARAKRGLKNSLPNTPNRKKAVSHKLFLTDFHENTDIQTLPTCVKSSNAISDDSVVLVQQFYLKDDISRQAPGRKDFVNIRQTDGQKLKFQLKHLTCTVQETYKLFCQEHPDVKIGKSKFADLRPKHVQLSSKLPHNVCLCKYHENFINAINALHNAVPTVPAYSYEFPETSLCAPPRKECWMNNCEHCRDGKGFRKAYPMTVLFTNVSWRIWKNDQQRKLTQVIEEGTVDDLKDHVCSLIPQFMEHCFIKRMQAKAYKAEREVAESASNRSAALMQVDFSENYTCVAQDEIQSAHWKQHQVSLFTASIWFSGTHHPLVIASDNLDHSKDTVVVYIDRLIEEIPHTVHTISIWSDGPSSQFKNRYVAASLELLQKKTGKEIIWNFFATSHGKGPVDGIGGSVKCQVWSAVRRRKCIVNDSANFVSAASEMNGVKIIEMASGEIEARQVSLNLSEVFKAAKPVRGISGAHSMRTGNDNVLIYTLSSDV